MAGLCYVMMKSNLLLSDFHGRYVGTKEQNLTLDTGWGGCLCVYSCCNVLIESKRVRPMHTWNRDDAEEEEALCSLFCLRPESSRSVFLPLFDQADRRALFQAGYSNSCQRAPQAE